MALTIFEDLEQSSPEWLQARAGIITASTIGQLIAAKSIQPARNDGSRGLIATLIAERITGRVDPVIPNRAMVRGTLLEPEARSIYAESWPDTYEIGFARRDSGTHVIGASPDALVGSGGGAEIKCPGARVHTQTVISDAVPLNNMAQVQTCLYVTGRDWWDFISYLPGEPLFVKRVYPDEKWHNVIRAVAESFEMEATEAVAKYRKATRGMTPTEYFDPFAEEAITFG